MKEPLTTRQRQMIMSLDNGSLVMSYPEPLSDHDIQDIQDSFAIWLRSVKRRPFVPQMSERDLYA